MTWAAHLESIVMLPGPHVPFGGDPVRAANPLARPFLCLAHLLPATLSHNGRSFKKNNAISNRDQALDYDFYF